MGDTLSQEEIDNLLKAFNDGDLNADDFSDTKEKQVKNYDFARPSKFSKDHLRTLEIIFENYGRLLSTNLPAYLRKNVQVEVVNAEANTYSEFANALSNPVILGVVNFAPLEGNIIIELSANLGFTIVDRMLGGGGAPLERNRDFTEIELIILERVLEVCTNLLVDPWESVVSIEPRLERIETNSQFAQFISPGEMTAIITMSVKIGSVEGLMNICIPYSCVEPVIDKLNTKYWYSSMKESDSGAYQEVIEDIIDYAKIPVKAMLGRSTISVNDYINIQIGDIIKLDTKVNDELEVYVGNIKKFTALPGATSDSYAVRVTSVIREEQ
ncbi:MAG: flagellar motor switch protein FliM [Butyribacter sp.]|jgi:flagellar motor switch protein FliM|uniref:Flagellar motor switch protein FliM n=1 Tax=Butyribacter intestini TaxID=1703332 RepID=A0AAW3JWY7_9FIRM|nr:MULTISPECIES: flagellar motor switch protein FliM [Clostridia]MBS5364241.1 flagellar motor switch protein FliM [Clostridium sp.]MCQ5165063.1 flagellar motor switch protein FliM [Roseburia hominis]OKZ79847.1 MAG: flagellar motor switch protein FliM [Clostridium sp. CAG:12237_41]UYJ39904.1 MAG: flagellar motor switch protein FliM [Lachnospiraceae bacterium]KQC86703.1 flagellar motor switch protein FliM [Butyribacter intestini]